MSVNLPERQKKLRFAQNLALTGYFSLLIILMLNIVWLIPSRHFPTALVLLLIVGPLLIPMRDLLNKAVSQRIHENLLYPFTVLLFLHIYYTWLSRRPRKTD